MPPTRRNDQSAFDAVLESVEWAYNQLAGTKKGITKTGLLNKLYFTYKFPNYRNGKPGCHHIPVEEVLHYNASDLIDALDASKWEGNDFYPWLKKMAKTEFKPEAMKLSDLPHRMSLRGSRPYHPRGPNASFSQPAQVVTGGSSHQGDNDDNTSLDELNTPRRGRGKGVKTPGRPGKSSLRPAASSKKRPRSDVDSDSDSESRDAKRSHYFSDADDTIEDADTSDHGSKKEEEDYVKIVLRADKIPSAVPRGPNETWTCYQDDCDYIVRGADAEECQERIRVHFKEHEEQTERVQLALTESRGHMPIKYAYFPPFLIIVHMTPPPASLQEQPSFPPKPSLMFPSSSPSPVLPNNEPLDLSRSSEDGFRRLVRQFQRKPQPVSDRIGNLTTFQPPPRQDQTTWRQSGTGRRAVHGRHSPPPPDPEETDSMTERE